MSPAYLAVLGITLLVIAFAVARGGQPEKWCAAIIGGEAAIDFLLLITIGARSFDEFDLSRIVLDGVAAALLIAISMRANRLYPLAIAAAQLVALIGSMAVLISGDGMSQAFWAMTQGPLFLQLPLLAGGTIAHTLRLSRIGPYNCWSPQIGALQQSG